ncbi:PadR family transcriptional regulator [Paeniglutamicibacter cryotolerans]|nr:PadR family transcriptional regulator [Paeniglutamicibacter cryotolerans]
MLILALLSEAESYGYELVTRLHGAGLDGISPGTVYPVLTRLEREGRLTSQLVASAAGPARKYYLATAEGLNALATIHDEWNALVAVVEQILPTKEAP